MAQPLFIGIDIGTQGTKTVLCTADGKSIAEAFSASHLFRPDAETVYEDAELIFSSVVETVRKVTEKVEPQMGSVAAIGIDSQMAGIMGIGKDGLAVTPYDSWLDSRCAPYTELLKSEAGNEAILRSGGQIIHTHASKILWWKNERPEIYKKIVSFVQPNAYVAGRLCGLSGTEGFMDPTFLHFNCFSDNQHLSFNESLLSYFKIATEKMPRIVPSESVIGAVKEPYASAMGIPEGIPVIAGCGDTAASSLGAGITRAGIAYDVAGTASVFACCTERYSPDAKYHTILYSRSVVDGLFLPLAYISGGGLCLSWYSQITGIGLKELDNLSKSAPPGANGVTFLPHFSGRTCPLDDNVQGAFLGLTNNTDSGILYRAIMESIAYEYRGYLSILRESEAIENLDVICGVGGGAKSAVFSQIKADVLGVPYAAQINADSAPGAMARLAGHATGYITGSLTEVFESNLGEQKIYLPNENLSETYIRRSSQYLQFLNTYASYIYNKY